MQGGHKDLANAKRSWAYDPYPYPQEVVPDIVTMGKPFGNGVPLAAVFRAAHQAAADATERTGVVARERLHHVRGRVTGTVVDDDDLVQRDRLRLERAQARLEVRLAVVVDDDGADGPEVPRRSGLLLCVVHFSGSSKSGASTAWRCLRQYGTL